jgi:exonuclease SbcD
VALGHVHRPQAVRGAPSPTRYAGSLLQLDFGETEQTKSVTIVEASAGRPAKVREVALSAGRRLLDVEGTLDEVLARGEQLPEAYLAFVHTDGPVPGVAERVRDALPNAVDVSLRYERRDAQPESPPVSSLAPRDQFDSYLRHAHGAAPAEDLMRAFDEVLAEVEQQG